MHKAAITVALVLLVLLIGWGVSAGLVSAAREEALRSASEIRELSRRSEYNRMRTSGLAGNEVIKIWQRLDERFGPASKRDISFAGCQLLGKPCLIRFVSTRKSVTTEEILQFYGRECRSITVFLSGQLYNPN